MIEEAFTPAKESVSWANDAITDLRATCEEFFHGDITEIVTNRDAETGENVQKVRLRKPLPKQMRRKVTEALTTTRHAFDQATFAARNLTSGRRNKSIYFPWSRDPTDMERLLKTRGIDERLWDVFAAHEPYPKADGHTGGDDTIRTMATMANAKHTVGLSVAGTISRVGYPDIHGKTVHSLTMPSLRWNPVKNEAELLRWIGDVEINGEYSFSFEILFKNARLPNPVNAISGLITFSEKANAVIESLQGRCMELSR